MIAIAMKIAVAVIERGEIRAMPQMPWPDVQPPPSRVPKPTSRPAAMMTTQLSGMCGVGMLAPVKAANSGAAIRPAMNAIRQLLSLPPISAPPTIPLMPAMRPISSMSRADASPINAPPMAAESGVKLAIMERPLFHRPQLREGVVELACRSGKIGALAVEPGAILSQPRFFGGQHARDFRRLRSTEALTCRDHVLRRQRCAE